MRNRYILASMTIVMVVLTLGRDASALSETCGNGIDDDGDGFADEGCYPGLTNGLVDSPLSTVDTGLISPSKGALYYSMPPDISARMPAGPSLTFKRSYVSMNEPVAGAPAYRKPLGDRWIHNFMSWIDDYGTTLVIHMPSGQEIQATRSPTSECVWETRGGQATSSFSHCPGQDYSMRMLDGSTLNWHYNAGTPRLYTVCDANTPSANCLWLNYNASNQVIDVTPTFSAIRKLHFTYTSNLLTAVELQINGVTKHTTSFTYGGNNLATVSFNLSLGQTNTYTSNYLTQISDASGMTMVKFAYDAATLGKAVRVDTPRGMVGFEFASTRSGCAGADKTVLYFNRGNTLSCSVDADCGAAYLCGGKTGAGSTGQCFRAARCLTVDLTAGHHEDLVTSVTALGPPSQTCDGACLDVSQYLWNNATNYVASLGTLDPTSTYTVRTLDPNGLPTEISFGDPDSISSNGNSARVMWIKYGNSSYPGLATEIRRKSDLHLFASTCSRSVGDACQITTIVYDSSRGKPSSITETGTTLNVAGGTAPFFKVTGYSYDSSGRVTQISQVPGIETVFEYWPFGPLDLRANYLMNLKRKRDATTYVVTTAQDYDIRGNAVALEGADKDATHTLGSLNCLTFDDARGFLTERRETMAGQTNCGTTNAADITTVFARDTALRLTRVTSPDGSCTIYEYGHSEAGRPVHLLRSKRRDDCLAASSGDRQEFVYDAEGLVTEIQTYDAAGTLTAKQPFSYFDSRRLERVINPVDTSKWTGLTYDARGLVTQIDDPGSLGKTAFHRDGLPGREGRVTSEDRYKDASTFDTWNLLYDWLGNQFRVTDGDIKATETTRDDLGRVVKLTSPDMTHPTLYNYDAASRLTSVREAFGAGANQQTHLYLFDLLSRMTSADLHGSCPTGTPHPEIVNTYDSPATCPVGMTCARTGGRLAYTKVKLLCSSAYADGSLDQETWFSYDDAGRLIREYIKDDTGRIADHLYGWTKNGALAQVTTPSGVVMGSTFGSAGSNSDSERVTALWQTNTSTPVIDNILWFPYGPLKQYNQKNQIGGVLQRTAIARNLAYRPTSIAVENQTNGADTFSVTLAEDAKGRVTKRDYTGAASGVQDSYFLYDNQDRVLCETTTLVVSCPTSGSNIKNSRMSLPYFTNAGDWNKLLRPVPGSTGGLTNSFNPSGYGTSHQVTMVRQDDGTPALGDTVLAYDARGNRTSDDNTSTLTNDRRDYTYDARKNVINVHGKYFTGGVWHDYDVASAFDARNRRVFKSFLDTTTLVQAQWFFYYDPMDRLVEVRYTPNAAAPSTYSVFQLFWLGNRIVLYWQTDYPSAASTRRYVGTDVTGRPLDMWTWPSTGNGSRVWAVDPSEWGFDTNVTGPTVFQPLVFAGQFNDPETAVLENNGTTVHRVGVVLNGFRTYDPFTAGYLQVDTTRRLGYLAVDKTLQTSAQYPTNSYTYREASLSVTVGFDACHRDFSGGISGSWTWGDTGQLLEGYGPIDRNQIDCAMDFHLVDGSVGPPDWFPGSGNEEENKCALKGGKNPNYDEVLCFNCTFNCTSRYPIPPCEGSRLWCTVIQGEDVKLWCECYVSCITDCEPCIKPGECPWPRGGDGETPRLSQ